MQEKNFFNAKTPVRYIKGVGPKKSEVLARVGIHTIEDIFYYLPKRYEDRSNITNIKDIKPGENQTVQGEIISSGLRPGRSSSPVFQAAISDSTGVIHAIWFNQPYLKDVLKKGARIILYGRVEHYDRLQMVHPEYEIIEGDEKDSVNIGRIVPVYALTQQLTQKYLRGLVFKAVTKHARYLAEKLPTYIIARQRLVDIRFAIRNIHFPSTFDLLDKAYRRIVFEEFLFLQLALALRKKGSSAKDAGLGHRMLSGEMIKEFAGSLPFELTEGQKNAIRDIGKDMALSRPMNRLLEGDVGSGKTVVAAYALVLAVQNGFQAVIMAPTDILARQHFIILSELLMPLGINIVLLAAGSGSLRRQSIYSEIKSGKADIVVGTHAVIQERLQFSRLGLIVIDEQHKFGVEQRAALRDKGYNSHVLVMTATPIPRTLALTVYGDLDISTIKEMPGGRKGIVTYWVGEERREKVYEFMKEELDSGRQAYVVCPLIEKCKEPAFAKDTAGRQGALQTYERLKYEVFKDYKVGLLHGKMVNKEKDKIMDEFKKKKIQILVSTVIIEVGVDIPNATVMLIENAERFGLSQLHQLRGRVGRGSHESYCILLSDPKTDTAIERLKAMEGTLDGFQIAQADMDIRGPGELFGTRQHGLPEIRFGNLAKDFDIMESARMEAFNLVERDPNFEEEHHRLLKRALEERFKGGLELIRVG